jgi:hypothetical protein
VLSDVEFRDSLPLITPAVVINSILCGPGGCSFDLRFWRNCLTLFHCVGTELEYHQELFCFNDVPFNIRELHCTSIRLRQRVFPVLSSIRSTD